MRRFSYVQAPEPKRMNSLRVVQILLGYTKLEITVRYLGVDAKYALTLSEGIEIRLRLLLPLCRA